MCFSSRLQKAEIDILKSNLETSRGHGPCRNRSSALKHQRKTAFTLRSEEIASVCTQQHRRGPVSVHCDEAKEKHRHNDIWAALTRTETEYFPSDASIYNLWSNVFVLAWDKSYPSFTLQQSFRRDSSSHKKKRDISQPRTWNPFSRKSTVSYWNVTTPDWLTALPLLRFCFIYKRTWNHNLRRGLIKPSNVLLIIKASHLAENDPREEITGLGFLTNTVGFDGNWLFSLCPGVTEE